MTEDSFSDSKNAGCPAYPFDETPEFSRVVAGGGIAVHAKRTYNFLCSEMLRELGCELFQGYLFARPEKGFPQPRV